MTKKRTKGKCGKTFAEKRKILNEGNDRGGSLKKAREPKLPL